MVKIKSTLWLLGILFVSHACQSPKADTSKLFALLPSSTTGIKFNNKLTPTEAFNMYIFRNFYNGGGVGLGDINNDGLLDIYFAGNMVSNKLYLNKGDLKFEDITQKAGVACQDVWSSGVSMADVNGDGWLDIYVCKSGNPEGKNRHNELFINNQNGTFTEKAKEFGIADKGLSTHAVFFDYDKDGDLDCYLLNNSLRSVGGYDLRPGQREIRDPEGGNKLYKNQLTETGKVAFSDVSEAAGIYGSAIGFGLGVSIGDLNKDGWQDIYVSNDYFEKDYLYLNQKDGTFKESINEAIREHSMGAMGADIADINNDAYPEIFVTDMLPEEEGRLKSKMTFEDWDKYQRRVNAGFHQQFVRNSLQLNNGNLPQDTANENVTFSEIGRLSGVNATDWSWGALIMDMDNDGWKDIFVANGIYKDLLDQDYLQFANPRKIAQMVKEGNAITDLIKKMPTEAISNYAFKNNGDLTFENNTTDWGLDKPSFSNGSAYGDLDNDGDLDLVVNNVNMPAFVYQNQAEVFYGKNHYLTIKLEGEKGNQFALGTQVTINHDGKSYYQELAPMRGFESNVDSRLHFGLGKIEKVEEIIVQWQNGKTTVLKGVATNQILTIKQKEAKDIPLSKEKTTPIFTSKSIENLYQHKENKFTDFDRDRLIYHQISREGPKICKGDVNGDGLEDFYIGGAKDAAGGLFIQQLNGQFKATNQAIFEADKISEDTDGVFFDADKDGDLDLYVASGGNEFPSSSTALIDRLYLNNGKGKFERSTVFRSKMESTGCVTAGDYDGDGDMDLFVGSRLRPFLYGVNVNGSILENDGTGNFLNKTPNLAPELSQLGMMTDAVWVDVDKDKDLDLVVVGEWMPITIFKQENGRFAKSIIEKSNGFWNTVKTADLDDDGDLDLVLGNHGQNTRLKASPDQPVQMHVNDFDQNGTVEQIITTYNGDSAYPLVLRHDLGMQMPYLKKKYLHYKDYRYQTMNNLFTKHQQKNTVLQTVYTTNTSIALNNGDGSFSLKTLPIEAQFSPTYGILVDDFNKDGILDILLGGNFHHSKPEIGIYDANYGLLLKGNGQGNFKTLHLITSGFVCVGEIRDLVAIKSNNSNLVLVGKNDDRMEVFKW